VTRYLVTYDLNEPTQNYDDLFDAIKAHRSYIHAMKSVWFIETSKKASEVRDDLSDYTSSNDELFVSKITAWASNNVDSEATSWLHDKK
jgi:hypothetical protein